MTLNRNVGKLQFENPLVVGAGICKTLADTKRALDSAAAGVEIGSITAKQRSGNTGDNFYAHWEDGVLIYTVNSLGMPNPGRDNVSTWAKEAIAYAHDRGKLIGINIAGDTISEIVMLAYWALELGFDWVTLNAGCPNKYNEHGAPLSILSFDLEDTNALLQQLRTEIGESGTELWWKPSPDTDRTRRFASWSLLETCTAITGIVTNNTVPDCFAFDTSGLQAIDFGTGVGGMGGPAVKPIAMGAVCQLSGRGTRLHLIGAGGVTYGRDIVDFTVAGAPIVMVTSAIYANNLDLKVPGEILAMFCVETGIEL